MWVATVTWRTGRALYVGSGGSGHHGQRALAGAHAVRADRDAAFLGERAEAELAEQDARLEPVDALPGERRAAALRARGGLARHAHADADEER